MATLKLSALLTGLAGKIGGTVFQRSKVGFVAKNTPAHTLIDSASAVGKLKLVMGGKGQVIFSLIATLWRALTQGQRATWIAGAVNFPAKNKFGDVYTPSGFQCFMNLNGNLAQNGLATLTNCPVPEAVTNPGELTLAYDPGTGISITPETPLDANHIAIVSSCVKQSAGRGLVAGRLSRIYTSPVAQAFPVQLSVRYSEVFGEEPQVGASYWFKMQYLNINTGEMSIPSFGFISVA